MKKLALLFMAYLCYTPCLYAQNGPSVKAKSPLQSTTAIKALSVGDKVPDIELKHVFNYPQTSIKLSDLKGKLVILDFWHTACGSCIDALPKMNVVQEKFGEQIQILLINDTKRDHKDGRVKTFFEKRQVRTGEMSQLPYMLDSSLKPYFPHNQYPHYVWIDKNGRVAAITSRNDVTEKNIQTLLEGRSVDLDTKNDLLVYDRNKPLLVDNNGGDPDNFIFRSILTRYNENLGGGHTGSIRVDKNRISKFFSINSTLMALLKDAYWEVFDKCRHRYIVEATDLSRFQIDKDFPNKNVYCYELITPPISVEEVKKYMQIDLKRFFNVVVRSEMRTQNCYILKVNNRIEKSFTKGGPTGEDWRYNTLRKYIRNSSVSVLVTCLQGYFAKHKLAMPVVDETELNTNIDIELPYDFHTYSIDKLKLFLSTNGFDLVEGKREMEIAVITDK